MILIRCRVEQTQKIELVMKQLKFCPHCGYQNNNIGLFPHQYDMIPACAKCGKFLWSELKHWQRFHELCKEGRANGNE